LFADAPGGMVPEKPAPLLVDKTTTPPPIDGVLDSTWFNVRNVNMLTLIDEQPDNWFDLFGRFRMMYDSKNLYMFVEVQDDSIDNSSPDAYANDGVELYFDGDNSKNNAATGYDAKDDQLRFEYGKEPTGLTGNVQLGNIKYAYLKTAFGYNVEIQMPFSKGLTFKAADGLEIGFEIRSMIMIPAHVTASGDGGRLIIMPGRTRVYSVRSNSPAAKLRIISIFITQLIRL